MVLHGPPPGGGWPAVRVRGSRLPGRARRPPRHVGVPSRAHRRGRWPLPVRPAERDRRRRRIARRATRAARRPDSPWPSRGSTRTCRSRSAAIRGSSADRAGSTLITGRTLGRGRLRQAGSGFGLALDLEAAKPPALHGGIGWIDFAGAGELVLLLADADGRGRDAAPSTTRCSRSRAAPGSTTSGATSSPWAAAGGTGSPSTSPTARTSRSRSSGTRTAPTRSSTGRSSTPGGRARALARDDFDLVADPDRTWTSPATGATYPAGWTIRIPEEGLIIDLEPTVAAQELDTRPTTGVVYWEGSQVVTATRDGVPVAGEAYVELTGYATGGPVTGPRRRRARRAVRPFRVAPAAPSIRPCSSN